MSNPKLSPAEAWRLSALANTVGGVLRQRFGTQKFYSADQVQAACDECHVPAPSLQYAVAMFVEPEQSVGFLQKLGSSKTGLELRKFMAQQIFFYNLPDASFDAGKVDFHESGDAGGATSGNFTDSGHDFSGFDGGGGGDGGGGSD